MSSLYLTFALGTEFQGEKSIVCNLQYRPWTWSMGHIYKLFVVILSFHKFSHNTRNKLTVYTLVHLTTCKLPQAEQITFQTISWLLLELLSQLCHRVARPKRKNTKNMNIFLKKSSKIYYHELFGFFMWIQITWFLWSQLIIETVSF